MSNIDPTQFVQEHLTPLLREPEALVENIYPVPGTESLPDLESQDTMGTYLIDRFAPEPGPRTRVAFTPSGHTLPGIQRIPSGHKEVNRWRKLNPKEWFITPRAAAAVALGSLVLFNGVGNHKTIVEGAHYVAHEIDQFFDPVDDVITLKRTKVRTPGPIEEINIEANTSNNVGETTVDPNAIQSFVEQVTNATNNGAHLLKVTITGNTSDEWSDDDSIGRQDNVATKRDNDDLGLERANAALLALSKDGLKLENIVDVLFKENILTPEEKAEILITAKAAGFESTRDAVRAVDRGQDVPEELKLQIDQLFTGPSKRGVTLSALVQKPGEEVVTIKVTKEVTPGKDTPPEVPDPEFYGFIPMLPIRRREKYTKIKQTHRWKFTPRLQILKPELIKEDEDQAWVRLRPEAINEDGTFVENAWAYTRKYEHLLRDNRIVDMIKADFKNAKGEATSLRVMFVDQAPAKETVELFESLLAKFAAMEDGKLGDRVSGIFVYPSENAGTIHGDPKKIAMGIDKQSEAGLLGTYTYPLDLVELHMQTDTWDSAELEEILNAYLGTAWIASHEIAGHGTDENDKILKARRIRTRNIANAHVIDQDPRARKMKRLDTTLRNLRRRHERIVTPTAFDIIYPVVDNGGRIVTMNARVTEGDPRLAHATQATIVGFKPTHYAGTNESEHYAETAASVTTGISVPFEEANVSVPNLLADDGNNAEFTRGYRPDTRGQALFTNSVGGQTESFPLTFSKMPEVRISHIHPQNDPLTRREKIRTSRLSTLQPHQMSAILARVARSKKQ